MVVVFAEKNGSFSNSKLYKFNLPDASTNNNGVTKYNGAPPRLAIAKELEEEAAEADTSLRRRRLTPSISPTLWWKQLLTLIQLSFLPLGYPESVSEDYLAYQVWDTIQDVSFGLSASLAASSVLKAGIGLGQESSQGTEVAFGVAFILLMQRTCTKIGPVFLGWAKCQTFDSKCKKWRLFADIFNDVILLIEICTPILPSRTIIYACCVASLLRGVVGVVGSASRASLIVHHARSNNAADVSTKESCQLNCAQFICLVFASALLPNVIQSQTAIFIMYFVLTSIHLYANIQAQRVLRMESLNESRILICLRQFLVDGSIPTIRTANQRESIFFGFGISDTEVCGSKIVIGNSLRQALAKSNGMLSAEYFDQFRGKSFLIIPCYCKARRSEIQIVLAENIYEHPGQLLEAYLRSVFVAASLVKSRHSDGSSITPAMAVRVHPMEPEITKQVEEFLAALNAEGFNCEKVSMSVGSWRCTISKADAAV